MATYNGRECEILEKEEVDGLIFYKCKIGDLIMVIQDKYVENVELGRLCDGCNERKEDINDIGVVWLCDECRRLI